MKNLHRFTAAALIAVLFLSLLSASALAAPDFQEITGLSRVQSKLSRGVRIVKVSYRSYSFSPRAAQFDTASASAIQRIWSAVRKIRISGTAYGGAPTCVGSSLTFTLSDGSTCEIFFTGNFYEYGSTTYQLVHMDDYYSVINACCR